MKKKLALIFSTVLVSILVFSVFAQVSVGLKAGDWVEYAITYTGDPPGNSPKRIRVDIQSVQGTTISMEIERVLLNGQEDSQSRSFDLELGAPYLLVVPANLNAGDEFHHNEVGYVTIDGVEDYSLKGETRTAVYTNLTQLTLRWDRATGILIQVDETTSTFTQKWLVDEINIGQSENSQTSESDTPIVYGVIIAVFAVLVIGGYFLLRKKRIKPQ